MRWGSERVRAGLGLTGLAGVPVVLFTYHAWFLLLGRTRPIDLGVSWIAPAVLALGLLYTTNRYRNRTVRSGELLRLGAWLAVGTVVLGGAGAGSLAYQEMIGATVVDPAHAALNWATGGAFIGLVVGLYDVERQRALREAVAARHRAERYGERLSVLNRVLRHDIRNRVTAVSGYAELIADGDGDPTADAHAIQQQAAVIASLSEKAREMEYLLDRDGLALERVDLADHVRSEVDALRARYPGVTFGLDAPTTAPVCAPSLVDSAIRNVAENAVEHNDADDPHVSITVTCDGDWVDVTVGDNGPGIPARERAVHETRVESPLEHSTGLGLWLADWVVTEAGGTLSFDSTGPDGSTVRLRLRAAD